MKCEDNLFSRNELFWGRDNQMLLAEKHTAVFGLGGVGGFCAEALARAGVGNLTIIDFDNVSISNINRQCIAFHSTVGQNKARLFEKRLKDINPDIKINVIDDFYTGCQYDDQVDEAISYNINFADFDFVADAIDTMRSKISLLNYCVKNNIPIISSMGAGNRIDPTKLYICDIAQMENKNAPFVSNIIYQLKKRDIESGITVVASREKPYCNEKISQTEQIVTKSGENIEFVKITPASTPFVASTAGIFMASFITQQFLKEYK